MKKIPILIALFYHSALFGQIEHFEPSSWWVGMQNPMVQIMVHGKDISSLMPASNNPGFKIVKVHKTENKNFLFLDILISKNQEPGTRKISFFSKSTEKCHFDFELKSRGKDSRNRLSFSNADVIYLITPDRFVNGKKENDSVDSMTEKPSFGHIDARHGGDIAGIVQNLPYIHNMGFTSIWSMPLLENNNPTLSYHGYGITDFYNIDPRYGTNEDYKDLIAKAKSKQLKVIQDVVLNHCGIGHWWLGDTPAKDWFNKPGTYTHHNRESHTDPYRAQVDLQELENGWFVPTMPDLNQRNPLVATYLIQNTVWWIEYAGLSGLRIDTYPYSNKSFLSTWSKAILSEYPNLNMVGEDWSLNPSIISYWQKNKINSDHYVSSVPSMMDFPLQEAIISSLRDTTQGAFSQMYQTLAQDKVYADPSNMVTFLDNHDMSRFLTQIDNNKNLYKLGMVALLTTRGIPQIYYGTELGMTNPNSDAHGEIRGDFDNQALWHPEALELRDFCKKLLVLRQKEKLLQTGKLMHFYPIDGLYVYFRYEKNDRIMIILNKSKKSKEVEIGRFEEMLPKTSKYVDLIDNSTVPNKIMVDAESFRVLRIL